MRFQPLSPATVLLLLLSPLVAEEGGCFVADGDRVGFFGDSITEAKVYGQVTEQVFRHFHPGAKVSFINNGHSGLQLAGTTLDTVIAGDPTVVVIMIGMNDAINASWVRGMPIAPAVEAYRAKLITLVQGLKERGKQVILLTPTLTDESAAISCFRIAGTRRLLRAFGSACQAVATAESIACIDLQDEFERYEESLPGGAQLRPDGVHPCARGHYQIARTLWTRLRFSSALSGSRVLTKVTPDLDVDLALGANLLATDSTALDCTITTSTPGPATITWSTGSLRGSERVTLAATTTWKLKLPAQAWPQASGKSSSLVVDIAGRDAHKTFVLDVFRKPVIHGAHGEAAGVIADGGVQRGSYRFRKEGKDLRFDATVRKPAIFHSDADQYPWGSGDALTLYLDLRPAATLGGLGFDGSVYQVWFKPQETPSFSPGFLPSSGMHMANIAAAYGERTADGYSVGLRLSGYVNIKERFDMADRDCIGVDLSLVYAAALGKQAWLNLHTADRQNFLFPGTFALIDLYGKVQGDSIISASVFPDRP